jgi:hypothetical protein
MEGAMTENDRALSALADEVNGAHATLDELRVPRTLAGELLPLPERIAWLNLTRPAPASPAATVLAGLAALVSAATAAGAQPAAGPQPQGVVIVVDGGVATVAAKPEGVQVVIADFDHDSDDPLVVTEEPADGRLDADPELLALIEGELARPAEAGRPATRTARTRRSA